MYAFQDELNQLVNLTASFSEHNARETFQALYKIWSTLSYDATGSQEEAEELEGIGATLYVKCIETMDLADDSEDENPDPDVKDFHVLMGRRNE